jgi:hypothetical protein
VAIVSGDLSERELNNYHKLLRERRYNETDEPSSQIRHKEQIIKRKKQFEATKKRNGFSKGLK